LSNSEIVSRAEDLSKRLLNGDRRALSRAISLVESDSEAGKLISAAIYPHTGNAQIVGVTGSAGAGKSTLVGSIAREERRRDRTIGIIAVDPSSPFSNGAILGDRIRMQDLTGDSGVFLRSMASRGNLGGLSETATAVADLLDAAGFDVVLIETVGAGQDEVEVANAAGTTVLVANPGAGDDVQSMKAGLMEVAQIMVVNKADLAGADTAVGQLRSLLAIADLGAWKPPILKTIASSGEGVPELIDKIDEHQIFMTESEHAEEERRAHARRQIMALSRAILHREAIAAAANATALDELTQQVAVRGLDPRSAAIELVAELRSLWSD
jgi:LAO/AO transport system kinase